MEVCKIKLNYMTDLLINEETYKARFKALPLKKIVKYHDFMRALFYFLQTDRELVCEDGTQCFNWKKARNLWNDDLIKKMKNYQVVGPKPDRVLSYHTIHFIEKLIEAFNEEDLTQYNAAYGLIYRWMTTAISYRK
jgi:hypothetical protein